MKIVVRAPNWVGDAILALPAIGSLRAAFPDAELTLAAGDWVRDVFVPEDDRTRVLSLNSAKSPKELRAAAETLRAGSFDLGILFTNSFGSALPFYKARIPERWGYKRDGRGLLLTKSADPPDLQAAPRHHVYYYLDLLQKLGLKTIAPDLRLRVPEEERAAARSWLSGLGLDPRQPLVLLNPGSSYGPSKRWPPARFAALGRLLQGHKSVQVAVTGSPDEAGMAADIAAGMDKPPFDLVGKTSLRRLLAVIGQAALLVTNDTGPMHMANALRIPVVAVFGPTEPLVTAPFHPPSTVLKKDVPCWPCLYRKCPFDHRCMTSISAEETFAACAAYLG